MCCYIHSTHNVQWTCTTTPSLPLSSCTPLSHSSAYQVEPSSYFHLLFVSLNHFPRLDVSHRFTIDFFIYARSFLFSVFNSWHYFSNSLSLISTSFLDVGSPFFKAGQSTELSPLLSLLLIEILAHLCHPDSNPPHLLTAAHVQFVVSFHLLVVLLRIAAHVCFVVDCQAFIFLLELRCYFHQNMSLTSFQYTVCHAKQMLLKQQYAHFRFWFSCTNFFNLSLQVFLNNILIPLKPYSLLIWMYKNLREIFAKLKKILTQKQ